MIADTYELRYHQSPCGLISTTPDGIILDANDTMLAWSGYSADDLIGRPFVAVLTRGSRLFFETRHSQVLHLQGSVDEVALVLLCADGSTLPILINSVLVEAAGGSIIRTAIFNATQRVAYEHDLLQARRLAETSETRVRVLQDVSGTFGTTANEQEVVDSFAQILREALSATEAAVMLYDESGELRVAAGSNPLWGVVAPVEAFRATDRELVMTLSEAEVELPELAAGMRAARLEALSIAPLTTDAQRLGLLVCFFGREREFGESFLDLQRALGRQASQTLVRVRLQRRLEYLALYDQLTGVPNRQFVEQRLDEAIGEAELSGQPLSVVFIDVDEFKTVNDRFGHAAGDAALRMLAQRFEHGVRAGDVVGRIGGDEFAAICSGVDVDSARAIADRILELSREPIDAAPLPLQISVSIGFSVYRPERDARPTPDAMLIRADDAMYAAKAAGKDQVIIERDLRGF